MAYKFQVGPAILSGSTTFEEAVSAASLSSVGASTAATLSASAGVSGASFDSDGDATFGTITMPGFAVDADGDGDGVSRTQTRNDLTGGCRPPQPAARTEAGRILDRKSKEPLIKLLENQHFL